MAVYCDGCGKKLSFQYKKLYGANFCNNCWNKLNADVLIKEEYATLKEAEQAEQELIKTAKDSNFDDSAISEIENYFSEIKSREYPIFVADGELKQKVKIFPEKCIIFTELDFPSEVPELSSELDNIKREIRNAKKIINEADARADYKWENRSLSERIYDYKNAPKRDVLKMEENDSYWTTVRDLRKPSEKRKEKEALDLEYRNKHVKDEYAPNYGGIFSNNLEKTPDIGDKPGNRYDPAYSYQETSQDQKSNSNEGIKIGDIWQKLNDYSEVHPYGDYQPPTEKEREFSTEILSTDEKDEAFNRVHDIKPGKRTILFDRIKDAIFSEPKTNDSFGYIKLLRKDGIPGAPYIFFSSDNYESMRQAFLQIKFILQERDFKIQRIQRQEEYRKINYCPHCGFKVQNSGGMYCTNCGRKLEE